MAVRTQRLRRTTDRVEDWAAWLLLATGMVLTLVSCVIGVRIHDQMVERGRMEAAERRRGLARLSRPELVERRAGTEVPSGRDVHKSAEPDFR